MAILHTAVHNKPKFDITFLAACELFSHLLLKPRHKRGILAAVKTSPAVSGWALTHLPPTTELGYPGWLPLRGTNRKYTFLFSPQFKSTFFFLFFPGRGPGDRMCEAFTGGLSPNSTFVPTTAVARSIPTGLHLLTGNCYKILAT